MQQYQQTQKIQQTQQDNQSSNASLDTSNQQSIEQLPAESMTPLVTRLKSIYHWLVEGRLLEAQTEVSMIAEEGRSKGDQLAVEMAGNIWNVSDSLRKAQEALSQENFSAAKGHASTAADISRKLQAQGVVVSDDANNIIEASGGFWTIADSAEKENKAKGASDTPLIDQHRLNHERNWAFCGIASMIMVLKANGKNPPTQTRADIQKLAQGIYITGTGTSGAGMAQRLRDNGLSNAEYTTTGTIDQIVATLDKGQPVPLGVTHSEGTVVELGQGGSKRYSHLRVGDKHYKTFSGSGHWLVVTSYEGDSKNPSSFTFHDPDVGGKLEVSRSGLASMAEGSGNMWMVTQ